MFLVCLMHREGVGFRIGTTSIYTKGVKRPMVGLKQRCIQEHADCVWVISTHDSGQEARLAELLVALRYGLPTLPLIARKNARDTGRGIVPGDTGKLGPPGNGDGNRGRRPRHRRVGHVATITKEHQ